MKAALLLATTAAAALVASTTALEPSPRHPINTTESSTRQLDALDVAIYLMCGVDIVGKDMDHHPLVKYGDQRYCLQYCFPSNSPGDCSGASMWFSHTHGFGCYRKDTQYQFTATNPKVDVDSVFKLKGKSADHPMVHYSELKEGVDMAGNDLTSHEGQMLQCMASCMNHPKCFAVTWTDYQGGWCWLKDRASAYVAKPGAWNVFLARKVTSVLPSCPGRPA